MPTQINSLNYTQFNFQNYGDIPLGITLPGFSPNNLNITNPNNSFNQSSYIEFFVYDNNKIILEEDYNFLNYRVQNQSIIPSGSEYFINNIIIDPELSLLSLGYDTGEYNAYYNILNKKIGSSEQRLFIKEISSDRTEIRLDSIDLSQDSIVSQTLSFIQERENSLSFVDFYLNFGSNKLVIATNIALDQSTPGDPTILIKLYQPLPFEFDINSQLWVVTYLSIPSVYQVIFEDLIIIPDDFTPISGPNFNLNIKDQINNSTGYLNYNTLTSTTLSSSLNQLNSLLEEKEIDINIDYTDFNNFTHFSSVKTRLENFYHKASLIEDYSSSISSLNNIPSTPNVSNSIALYETEINNIITNFDGYDYYLYYSSGSWAWPKLTTEPPYLLAPTGSALVNAWYPNIIISASNFDEFNPNNLYYAIPEYLRDDPSNQPYELFINMVGQFYDNIWVYYKDVTEKYNADNRLEYGVSKDIVADAIRDFGIKLYQNNFSNDDLYTAFIGLTPEGGLFPFPNITGSLPTPSGFEYVNTLISASNDYMPLDDVNKSLYKRIYHNLPYLLKSKGTLPGLRTLITSYGIPDTILRIKEYGGKDKVNVNDWDYWQDTFNYAFYTTGSNSIFSDWKLNPNWNSPDSVPSTLEFRFKTEGLPTSSIPYSQSLWYNDTYSSLVLQYTGSGYATGSYSGSIIDPYYQYANLIFYPDPVNYPASSASIYLPFFDGGWWSTMITRNGNNFNLYAGNKIYEGGDNGTLLGFYASSSINEDSTSWILGTVSTFAASNIIIPGGLYEAFSGSLQEIKYYNSVISESVFKDYIMNPHSIEGNSTNSSPNELAFRAPLGGELYTGSVSIHPKITGSWSTTSSFNFDSNFTYTLPPVFNSNTEYFFIDQPLSGIRNAISDKIRFESVPLPSGDVLSPFRPLAQNSEISQSYTANTNLLEVAFSPQDEINDDIANQIGYYNIGEYIGDPRFRSSSALSYPELDTLRNNYFEKYTKNYNLNDFIRLIKFFDNSLFKMIKDFVPARTSLASGIVIKQHLLERNRYPEPQVEHNTTIAYTTSGSQNNIPFIFQNIVVSGTLAPQWNDYQPGTVENFSGGPAGVFNPYNSVLTSPYGENGTGPNNIYFLTQSWSETIKTPIGLVNLIHDAQDEFYDGEFSGSVLTITTQSLFTPYPLDNIASFYKQVHYYGTSSAEGNIFENLFLNNVTAPQSGSILFFNDNIPNVIGVWTTKYLKIARIDCSGSDNTNVLENINKALIFNNVAGQYIEYDLTVLNEQSTYYLYECAPRLYAPALWPNQVLDYTISASGANVGSIITGTTIKPYSSVSGNSLGYFNSTTGIHTLGNTPNTPLSITGSISVGGLLGVGTFFLSLLRQGNTTTLSSVSVASGNSYSISSSYYGLQGDQIFTQISNNSGILTAFSGSLLVTQSRALSSSNCESVIFEPYITEPNYYYSDYNVVMNNIAENRLSTIYEEVSYNPAIQTPSNFAQIISGSAIKADVQDSNYSSKRVINPRYDGVKSTSQQLNVWTPGDTGTYGKTPTAENLKTMVAYCDSISGWPPERMNASAVHILYLIKDDGTVVIPNTSENSLYENKGTFESGEKLIISPKTTAAGNPLQYRNIIRGGTRIEPILYTQYGSAPNASWNTTLSFEDIIPSNTGVIGNYTALYSRIGNQILNYSTPEKVLFNGTIYGTSIVGNSYNIPLGVVQDGVNLVIDAKVNLRLDNPATSGNPRAFDVTLFIYKNSSPIETTPYTTYNVSPNQQDSVLYLTSTTLPAGTFTSGDTISIYVQVNNFEEYPGGIRVLANNTQFEISQYPIYTPPFSSSGYNSIWGYVDTTNYPNVITSSQSTLTSLYGNPNVKMTDITGSGFNPITLPWSIKYGDEFRFEGREDFVYQVGKIFGPGESGSGRITQTGSIEVHFNNNLPVSASSSVFNLDHFLIRRYIDDASLVLMEGYKPINSSGPFIVRPEYVVPELNKTVDEFILDLTQKGLIP